VKSLKREIFVPTALVGLVVAVAMGLLARDSAVRARALERDANDVRTATALALALMDATHDEEHWVFSLAVDPAGVDASRLSEPRDRVEQVTRRIAALPLSPRVARVWSEFVDSRSVARGLAIDVRTAAQGGDRGEVALALDKWHLMADRADRLLRSFTAYHLSRLDRTVGDLQRRRARAFAAAAIALVAGLLLASALAAVVARTVVAPIVEMARTATRISATGTATPVAGAERRDELGVLARAFNDMTERLVSANEALATMNASLAEGVRAREEFISIASHELKTPITPLTLRVQQLLRLARDGSGGAVPREQVVQATRDVDKHLGSLTKLVNNLLDFSRIKAGQLVLQLEDFPLCETVREVVESLSRELSAAGCDVRVDCPHEVMVHGDRSRVEQVIVNLLGNVAKHAPGCPVAVRLAAEPSHVVLEVEDGGPGIGARDQERIFERFERAVADRHVSGLGLGLYIAAQIVAAHGGELTVRSEVGRGATFRVRLRREPPSRG
jgi:signal transduction histidine kinase